MNALSRPWMKGRKHPSPYRGKPGIHQTRSAYLKQDKSSNLVPMICPSVAIYSTTLCYFYLTFLILAKEQFL